MQSREIAIRVRHLRNVGWVLTIHADARAADDWAAAQRHALSGQDVVPYADFAPSWRAPRAVILEAREALDEIPALVAAVRDSGLIGTLPIVLAAPVHLVRLVDEPVIDDFVIAPAQLDEIGERIRRVEQRRAQAQTPGQLRVGPLHIDLVAHEATVDGRQVGLTRLEYGLLVFLIQHQGRAFTRGELLAQVWEHEGTSTGRSVDIHVRRLRAKLGAAVAPLETVRGVGYRFLPREPAAAAFPAAVAVAPLPSRGVEPRPLVAVAS